MSARAPAARFDQDALRRAVDTTLTDFMEDRVDDARRRGLPQQAAEVLAEFVRGGGKRIRPMLCLAGWQAAGGAAAVPPPVLKAAASLEMFHAFALIHDDIIDLSDTRRGRPTVHRRLNTDAALLIGDLALVFADDLLHGAALTPAQLRAALPITNSMRADTIYGQYLDVSYSGNPPDSLDPPLAIIRYKTARYTVEGPLLLGAALADVSDATACAPVLSAYGIAVGEAFQLRDDLLGVFGDPAETGKPALDDLREGKATVLMALALRNADAAQRATLHREVGNPRLTRRGAEQVRAVLTATGARAAVEEMIDQRRRSALAALDAADMPPHIAAELRSLAFSATARTT
ncbi:polyprenyl synthetase family protein [Streptomyces sp. H28]|uniref:polyprenyl synthetase family protein n=1 Tax=Streptomyces sp. H28 TaxID=2775865 RepID=UPI00177B85D6|nr:polyprenyl synthetase family protein [Streptomyces sp. H28]MBD9730642.1 polyprenyl synthetase family protein [Streptomyces sp. H28]